MKSEHAFALMALILGIIGGVLLCKGAINVALKLFEGSKHINNVESLVLGGIGVLAISASVMLWAERYLAGGVLNIVLGIITVFTGKTLKV